MCSWIRQTHHLWLQRTAFLQAIGVTAYIAVFASIVQSVQTFVHPQNLSPILGISLFLLAFVTSALICATIVFGYPVTLFLGGRTREALEVVGWTMLFLTCSLLTTGAVILIAE